MDFSTPYDAMEAGCGREAFDVRFSYYTAEEIRKVSAKQVTSIDAFSELDGVPCSSGLHANEMGPISIGRDFPPPCPTCGLDRDCPGHMGHINLACPCYNPFLMQDLFKLLRRTCMSCHQLKVHRDKTERVVRTMLSIVPGALASSNMLPHPNTKKPLLSESGPEEPIMWFEEDSSTGQASIHHSHSRDINQQVKSAEYVNDKCQAAIHQADARLEMQKKKAEFKESASIESFRTVLTEYYAEFPTICANCGEKNAKWRKDGYTKLFCQKPGGVDEFYLPVKVKSLLHDLWAKEAPVLRWLFPGSIRNGSSIFFLEALLIPPNRFRPPNVQGGNATLRDETVHLRDILVGNERMRIALLNAKDPEKDKAAKNNKRKFGQNNEDRPIGSIITEFQVLQEAVNSFLDSTKGSTNAKLAKPGVRQLLEKKEGMFRMKMMGKRVNQAARSVISPDLNIETTEIGVPQMIAEVLTYAETANSHNAEKLGALIRQGDKYPGASEVHVTRDNGSKRICPLNRMSDEDREVLSKQLMTDVDQGKPPITVFRHIRDGDPLLVNRQPTLHKPGIMAHIAKVMSGEEKTIRMHYANCNTYNADFDGDEMNLHAPQDPIGRIEALQIAKADKQFLVPTSGKPLRGLIQDHVIGGVMLTRRDCYLSKSEACTLLYVGLRAALENGDLCTPKEKTIKAQRLKAQLKRHPQKIKLLLDEPTMLKPRRLYTGKQVLSMLLKNIFILSGDGKECEGGINMNGKAKTPGDMWNGKLDGNKEEGTVIFQGTELLMGVLDKNAFGATGGGLTHLVHEVLGPKAAGMVLAAFARLFSSYLQMRGFTCAYRDLELKQATEEQRTSLISNSRRVAQETIIDWLGKHEIVVPNGAKATSQELSKAGRGLIEGNRSSADSLEASMLGRMRSNWTGTIDACIPAGQKLCFPLNCMSAMTQTGAKGSKVNQSQISCLLGQQELEGRQVPLMPTRRSLPCFAAYDLSSRTRGYITDRFLTGIRPQEFFFHCMAGREGLVDTAVKTSRSGYLQRCLVKHLECLKVCYDLTVRDNDGTVVQFLYGDDGADVTLSSHLFKFDVLYDNFKMLRGDSEKGLEALRQAAAGRHKGADLETASDYFAAQQAAREGKLEKAAKKLIALEERAGDLQLDAVAKKSLQKTRESIQELHKQGGDVANAHNLFEPVSSVLSPAHHFGCTSEYHEQALQKFITGAVKSGKASKADALAFSEYMRLKFMKSLCGAGEAVGVIAAQSMGEPSTQMTLNTFHLAGHGGANVTLGIPRLREIVQTASRHQSSPLMKVEVLADAAGKTELKDRVRYANMLAARFRQVKLMDIVKKISVDERVRLIGHELVRTYHCRFEFWNIAELVSSVPHLSRQGIEEMMTHSFTRHLKYQVSKLQEQVKTSAPKAAKVKRGMEDSKAPVEGDDDDGANNAGKGPKKRKLGRGERDGDEHEEAVNAEEEKDNARDKDDKEGSDDGSGMYDTSDSEKEDEKEDGKGDGAKEEEVDEDGQTKEKVKIKDEDMDEVDEDPFQEMDEPGASKKTKGAKADKAPKLNDEEFVSSIFKTAADSGNLVWSGKLEDNDAIDLVVTLRIASCSQKLLVGEVVKQLSETTNFQDPEAKGVQKVHVQTDKGKVFLECEGTNLRSFQLLPQGTLDVNKISTNDIGAVLDIYGVEAARANIVKEIRSVFGHYGIEVNHRHLSLIGDFMSKGGGFSPFNRRGMLHCMSPFLQMSYETTMQFCQAACADGIRDTVESPASAIIVGKPAPVGTGMVSLLVDLEDEGPIAKKKVVKQFKFGAA